MNFSILLIAGLVVETFALIFEFYRHHTFSPTNFLREENERLRNRELLLLDRLMMITTGAPLELPKETIAESEVPSPVQEKLQTIKKKIFDAVEAAPLPTFQDLLHRQETESFLKDAGLDAETELSAMSRSEEDLSEEQLLARDKLKKEFRERFNRAQEEYLSNTRPVITALEKAN